MASHAYTMGQRQILRFWLPLAASWALMTAEGPVLQAAIARLKDMQTQLAAFGIVMSVEISIESPVIMLLATSTALSTSRRNYLTLRRFVIWINLYVTVVAVLVAFTPVYDTVVRHWMGIPAEIADAARPGMKIMTLWSAAIGFRRFLQGVLIRHGETRWVGLGTVARLLSSGGGAITLAILTALPGVWVAAIALMAGVVTEAVFVWHAGRPTVSRIMNEAANAAGEAMTLWGVTKYHVPLAATSLLTLLAQPIIGAGLARMPDPAENLAAWPVIWGILFVLRSPGLALPEAVIALVADSRLKEPVRVFCRRVGYGSSVAISLLALTPLLGWYLNHVAGIPERLSRLIVPGLVLSLALPLINSLHSWYRGLLMSARRTDVIYRGMAVNLFITSSIVLLGVLLSMPGVSTGVVAVTLAHAVELLYLRSRVEV